MNFDDFFDLCKQRRSVRKYTDKNISDEDINKIIEAGIQAPSGTNLQGWKFKILKNKEEINTAADVIEKKVLKVALSYNDGVLKDTLREYGKNFFFFKDAPLVIFLYAKKPNNFLPHFFKEELGICKGTGVFLSLGMVMQNMMLAAFSLGISSCPLTGPILAEEELNEVFIPPKKYEFCGLLSFGYTDENPKSPGRKDLEKFII
ncbi:MAG: hypothetical protein A2086_10005 [Spirochaetes bacterium GWD1_27_9]|nr:MAG: hypothetical protein A2Z98_13895 [Spirochaetes bacterium GWB1_27_13]OHD22893.1 MAG: hypothetical protein A2Y34_16540 [Spirochaetes bacterium GWC1_27_15]OHD42263.1 MAG: hypothetical protein A2086_10005 [Spirochaetes bacterium GWD1_27_9]